MPRRLPALFLGFAALLFLSRFLPAQTVGGALDKIRQWNGPVSLEEFGRSVSGTGDLDGDGLDDVAAGQPFGGGVGFGSVFAFSGLTGEPLWKVDGPDRGFTLGMSLAGLGDLDGDGVADLVAGASYSDPNGLISAGSAVILSGAAGDIVRQFDGQTPNGQFGNAVAGTGDLDGDGIEDILIGASAEDPNGVPDAGSAYVFSGATGALLFRIDGPSESARLGTSIAGTGDVDGDGAGDFLVGAPQADPNGLTSAGSAYLYSGATAALIRRLDGPTAFAYFGCAVAGAGDVDGDGTPDILVGAPFASPNGLANAGSAFLFSGATGGLLRTFDGQAAFDQFGQAVGSAGDVDGDGIPESMVSAPRASANGLALSGSVFLFSGASGSPLFRFDGLAQGDQMGSVLSGAGDVDGDGQADFLAGSGFADPDGHTEAGMVLLFGRNPILTASAEVLSVSGGGSVDYTIDFPDADAGAGYTILMSAHGTGPALLHGLLVPLARDSLFRASLRGSTPPQASGFQGTLDGEGKAAARITAPPGALGLKLLGRRFPLTLAVVNSRFDFSSVARSLEFIL